MRVVPDIDAGGTSFHNTVLFATPGELKRVLGEPTHEDNSEESDLNFSWEGQTEAGDVVTVYLYKVHRAVQPDEEVCFHVGGFDRAATERAKRELLAELPGHEHARTASGQQLEQRLQRLAEILQRANDGAS